MSLWSVYKVAENLRVGAGLDAIGKRFANATNITEVPAYTRSDWMISYQKNVYAVRINVLNAFDKKIYEGVYQGHVVPGTARTTQVTFEYKFL